MSANAIASVANYRIEAGQNGLDVASSVKSKYGEFLDLLGSMARAVKNNEEIVFPFFPNSPVAPDDPSFSMLSSFTMEEFSKAMSALLKTEEYEVSIDKQMQGIISSSSGV